MFAFYSEAQPVQSGRPVSSDRPVPDRHQQGPRSRRHFAFARGRRGLSTQRAMRCYGVALTREVTLRVGYSRTREATTRAAPTLNRNKRPSLQKDAYYHNVQCRKRCPCTH